MAEDSETTKKQKLKVHKYLTMNGVWLDADLVNRLSLDQLNRILNIVQEDRN